MPLPRRAALRMRVGLAPASAEFDAIKSKTDLLRAKVRHWWEQRLSAGSQLGHPELFFEGWDYRGDGPWYDEVAVDALHKDFMAGHADCTVLRFLEALKHCKAVESMRRTPASLVVDGRFIKRARSRKFYRMRKPR